MLERPALLLLIALTAFGVTYLLTPTAQRLAVLRGWVDVPDNVRRNHHHAIPRIGGLAIAFGLVAGLALGAIMAPALFAVAAAPTGVALAALGGGLLLVALLGFTDDVHTLPAHTKLVLQVAAALPLLAVPAVTDGVAVLLSAGPAGAVPSASLWLVGPVVVGAVVFIMNAVNLIDGLDGLAGGVSLVMLFGLALMGALQGSLLVLATALAGALIAFLRYNTTPATVFMGDLGSLLLGYLVAVLALCTLTAVPTASRLLGLLVLLGLPLMDTLLAFTRRLLRGLSPFAPDGDHLHHRLHHRLRGHTGKTVLCFYLFAGSLAALALLIVHSNTFTAFVLFGAVLVGSLLIIWELGYFDRRSYALPSKAAPAMLRRLQPPRRSSMPHAPPRIPHRTPHL